MAEPASKTIRIPSGLRTRAAVEGSTFDADRGTVEVVFTTGARGKRRSWDGEYYEELEVSEAAVDLSRLNNGAPVLNAHSRYELGDVIGVVERAWLADGQGRALLRFSEREDVKPIRDDVAAGIIRHVSVGYSIQKLEKVQEIDGVPVYRATRWTPAEISPVPIGFDDGAVVRAEGEQEFREVELETRNEEQAMSKQTTNEGAAPVTPVAPAAAPVEPAQSTEPTRAQPVDPQPAVNVDAERAAAVAAERERISKIGELCKRHGVEQLGSELVRSGATVENARAAILDSLATRDEQTPTTQHISYEMGEGAGEKFKRGIESAIIARAGMTSLVTSAKDKDVARAMLGAFDGDAAEFRGWGLADMARECLELQGITTRRMSRDQIISRALVTRGMNSSSDFPILLESAMGKVLLASYAMAQDTWRTFCGVKSVPDFRAANMYRTGSFGTLDEVGEGGEYKNKSIPDGEKVSVSLTTKGNIIAITRKALVNDDLGAFMDLAAKLGRAAGLSIESAVYALLAENSGLGPTQTDASPFFDDTARSNVGTGAALSVDALDADAAKMAEQTDPSGNEYLDLQPAVLLVPRSLKGQSDLLNDSQYDPTNYKLQIPNRVRGMFRAVVGSPRLTGTRRYLFADPMMAPAIVVSFLNGQQSPELFTEEGWRMDGTEMKVRLDFGVDDVDYRGAVTNAGTAG